jgi:hypothetical protein
MLWVARPPRLSDAFTVNANVPALAVVILAPLATVPAHELIVAPEGAVHEYEALTGWPC